MPRKYSKLRDFYLSKAGKSNKQAVADVTERERIARIREKGSGTGGTLIRQEFDRRVPLKRVKCIIPSVYTAEGSINA